MAPTRPQPTITSFMNGRPILCLAAEGKPGSLNLGQPGLADLGLGGRDVVRHPLETNGRPAQVDDGEGGSRVPVARLADAPRVDQSGGGQRNPVTRRWNLFTLLGEDPRQMGVAKKAPARPQPQQDLERLELLEDVLPEVRLARAAVDVTVAVDPAELGQGSQVASARRGEHRLGPASGGGRVRIEP